MKLVKIGRKGSMIFAEHAKLLLQYHGLRMKYFVLGTTGSTTGVKERQNNGGTLVAILILRTV